MGAQAVVAGIQGATQLGGAILGSRATRDAARSQNKMGIHALSAEMRREKGAAQREQRDFEDYQRRHQEWLSRRQAERGGNRNLIRTGPPNPGAAPPPAGVPGVRRPTTVADILGMSAGPPTAAPGAPGVPGVRTVEDILNWNEWGV